MGRFGVFFDAYVTTTSIKTAAALHADAAAEEGEITELIMTGSHANPADVQHLARFVRGTNATPGTGTAQTAEAFDSGASAARLAATVEFSAEPGALASVYPKLWGFNQRGGMQWGVPKGFGIKVKNVDTNLRGFFQVQSNAAGEVNGNVVFDE